MKTVQPSSKKGIQTAWYASQLADVDLNRHSTGKLTVGANAGQNEVGRLCCTCQDQIEQLASHPATYPLSNDVADCPCKNDVIVLILEQIEVLFHPGHESIGDVGGVDLETLQPPG